MSEFTPPPSGTQHGERDLAAFVHRLLASEAIGLAAIAPNGVVRDANQTFLTLVGYARTELAAERVIWARIVRQAPPEGDGLRGDGAIAGIEQRPRSGELTTRAGRTLPVRIGEVEVGTDEIAFIAVVADRSASRKAEADRERLLASERAAHEEAREANRAKDQFLAVLSHELRNPLAPITTAVEVLRRLVPGDERVQRAIGVIERNARLQARLVGDLLDLSRITRGKLQLQRAAIPLDRLVAQAIQECGADAERCGLTVRMKLEPELWAWGDPLRLEQILDNLLSNAFKFTEPGGHVEIELRREGERARLSVEDSGIGMDASQIERMFAVFQQGSKDGVRSPGLGVGLTVVKSLVDMHGGRVWAQSAGPGLGSRFTVELPLMERPGETRARPAAADEPNATRVLLVEDNDDARTMLTELLANLGYLTEPFASGEEGLAGLERFHPDIILADIGLPGIDGYEFLRRARLIPTGRDVPAFAITAYGQAKDIRAAREAGFQGHFVKPVDLATLHVRMREAIGRPLQAGAELAGAPL